MMSCRWLGAAVLAACVGACSSDGDGDGGSAGQPPVQLPSSGTGSPGGAGSPGMSGQPATAGMTAGASSATAGAGTGAGSGGQPSSAGASAMPGGSGGAAGEPTPPAPGGALAGMCPDGFTPSEGMNTDFPVGGSLREFNVWSATTGDGPRPLFVALTGTVQEELAFAAQSGLSELPASGWIV